MTIEELLGYSNEQLAAMTDEQLKEILSKLPILEPRVITADSKIVTNAGGEVTTKVRGTSTTKKPTKKSTAESGRETLAEIEAWLASDGK